MRMCKNSIKYRTARVGRPGWFIVKKVSWFNIALVGPVVVPLNTPIELIEVAPSSRMLVLWYNMAPEKDFMPLDSIQP